MYKTGKKLAMLCLLGILTGTHVFAAEEVTETGQAKQAVGVSDETLHKMMEDAKAGVQGKYYLLNYLYGGMLSEEQITELFDAGMFHNATDYLIRRGYLPEDYAHVPAVEETMPAPYAPDGSIEDGRPVEMQEPEETGEQTEENLSDRQAVSLYGHYFTEADTDAYSALSSFYEAGEDIYLDMPVNGTGIITGKFLSLSVIHGKPFTLRFFEQGTGERTYSWTFADAVTELSYETCLHIALTEEELTFADDTELPFTATLNLKVPDTGANYNFMREDGTLYASCVPDENGMVTLEVKERTPLLITKGTGQTAASVSENGNGTDTAESTADGKYVLFVMLGGGALIGAGLYLLTGKERA